ncbi:MAG: substrate-binding domain-containing protein [Planctomycetota bacterium]
MTAYTPSSRVASVRDALRRQVGSGILHGGARFLSAREIARRYGVSYQTADRLLTELTESGRLVRRPRSGTYLPGFRDDLVGPVAVLPRAEYPAGSFGERLRRCLREALFAEERPSEVVDRSDGAGLPDDRLPVVWDAPGVRRACRRGGRRAVLVHDVPRPDDTHLFDAVSIDNQAGGFIAAETIRKLLGRRAGVAVLAGPKADPRSVARVEGFTRVWPRATVLHAGGWSARHGRRRSAALEGLGVDGLFCVNDRLAQGVIVTLRERRAAQPLIIGFDNAPIADELELTTVAIPWRTMTGEVRAAVQRRLAEPDAPARRVEVVPRLRLRRVDSPAARRSTP